MDNPQQKTSSGLSAQTQMSAEANNEKSIRAAFESVHREYYLDQECVYRETRNRVEEAYGNYSRALLEAVGKDEAQRLVQDAAQAYTRSVEEAMRNAQTRFADAYIKYLRGLQRCWSEAHIENVNSNLVLAIAQSMASVACSQTPRSDSSGTGAAGAPIASGFANFP